MRLKWIVYAAILLAFSAGLVLTAPIAMTTLPEPIPTRQDTFEIPFRIPPVRDPADTPVSVRLYVSNNSGGKYDLHSTVEPGRGKFVFRAPHDGEYWFLIRTVDAMNRVRPEGDIPELRVIVDTTPPRLDLQATRGASGEIVAKWQMLDPNLVADTFKVEYQTADQSWSRVALDPSANSGGLSRAGDVSWWAAGANAVRVRAEVSDIAGNVSRMDATVGSTADSLASSSSFASENRTAVQPASTGQVSGQSWPADRTSDVPYNRSTQPNTTNSSSSEIANSAIPQNSGTGALTRSEAMQNQLYTGQTLPYNPSVSGQVSVARPAATNTESVQPTPMLPPGERPRMVNTQSFDLEYEVESIGPSGIGKVELWGTKDGGQNWTTYGIDPDSRSPIRVNVEGEGVYGFRISVQSGSGLGGAAPQSGDQPEVWVGIDLTKPSARLTTTEAGSGERAGELIVHWEAFDQMLGQRPISLSFSPDRKGPWYTIAAGLENVGSYGWRLDNRVPDRVFLRLEVRDEAGNITLVESPDLVVLERIRPTGRIRDVRPAGETATGGKRDHGFN